MQKNLKNWDIENLFTSEEQKNNFSKKYIDVMKEELKQDDFIPSWIEELKTFFNS